MNVLDCYVTKILDNKIVDIKELGKKREVTYQYDCYGELSESVELFDIEDNWQKRIYVGAKLLK